jgi:serine/threonine protein kinase
MRPGPRIGRYEVLDHLASGGMGQVYLARATGLGGFERQVVIKTLDTGGAYDDEDAFVTMFLDEARLVGALHHQYIAPVHEVGWTRMRYCLVLDYIHGETAEAIWKASETRSCRVPLGLALTIGSAVASALDYAHDLTAPDGTPLEIVHRDVSLSNIMVGHDGSVRLIDFGIARSVRRGTRTEAGTLKGKIGYLAPEQIVSGQPVDHRADIFALGIVLYELTTGTRAFQIRPISSRSNASRAASSRRRRRWWPTIRRSSSTSCCARCRPSRSTATRTPVRWAGISKRSRRASGTRSVTRRSPTDSRRCSAAAGVRRVAAVTTPSRAFRARSTISPRRRSRGGSTPSARNRPPWRCSMSGPRSCP